MGKQLTAMEQSHREFILRQRIFFTGTAAPGSRVNVSPKDGASLRIVNERAVAYLDLTGSGSETSAHLLADGRLTLMFCALEGAPLILRLYGKGRSVVRGSAQYGSLLKSLFEDREPPGARQIVWLDVDRVQTSCGFGVPLFEYEGERPTLIRWGEAKGEDGLAEYRRTKNAVSIDGLPTGMV
jgi:Pyridoxamine 5'-phosphate oxidase